MVKMKRTAMGILLATSVFVLSVAFLFAANSSKKDSEAKKAASQMLAALGGESFSKLSSFQISGSGFLPRQTWVKVDFAQKGEKLRSQIQTQFWGATEGFDGASGWRRFGREKAFKLAQSPLGLLARNGLVRLREIGKESLSLGPDTLIGKTNCLWLKSLDTTSGELWIFVEEKSNRPKELFSPPTGITAGLADYRLVGGVWFPHKISVRRSGQSLLELTLDSVTVNPPLSDSLFSFPME